MTCDFRIWDSGIRDTVICSFPRPGTAHTASGVIQVTLLGSLHLYLLLVTLPYIIVTYTAPRYLDLSLQSIPVQTLQRYPALQAADILRNQLKMSKNIIHQTWSTWRDWITPVSHTSTFRETGKITPEEFILAGDYLVFKFPSWQWSDASTPAQRVPYLPEGKQYLVTRGVPCHRRLNENFAGDLQDDVIIQDMLRAGASGSGDGDDDGWLQTGGKREYADTQEAKRKDVRTVDEAGNVGDQVEDDDEIPDMEDDDDDEEAIIRDPAGGKSGTTAPLRTYNLYITYANYYRTPRLYLSGYLSPSEPLSPHLMMEDIVGDYKDKTVTLEDFPWFDTNVPMATVHPCQHASVMKILLDRADAALKIRRQKLRNVRSAEEASNIKVDSGLEGLVDDTAKLSLAERQRNAHAAGVAAAGGNTGDEWEVLQHEENQSEEDELQSAIRVDQYLIVFLKFIASVTPGIEHDFTMGV